MTCASCYRLVFETSGWILSRPGAIEALLNGDPRLIMLSSDAFSMGIKDYVEK